jgi:glutaredoxin
MTQPMHVTVYSKPGCHLCEDTLQIIDRLTSKYALDLTEVNILEDMAVYEQYREIIPVVEVTDVSVGRLVVPISEAELHAYFTMALDTLAGRSPGPNRSQPASLLSKLAHRVARHRVQPN